MIERMHFLFIRPYFCFLFDDACSNRIEYPNEAGMRANGRKFLCSLRANAPYNESLKIDVKHLICIQDIRNNKKCTASTEDNKL